MTIAFFNLGKAKENELTKLIKIKKQLAELDKQKKELEAQEDALKLEIGDAMRDANIKIYADENIQITLKDGYLRKDFDKTRFQKENPDEYNLYLKDTTVNPSMLVKIKG